jgi:hypothetical protein
VAVTVQLYVGCCFYDAGILPCVQFFSSLKLTKPWLGNNLLNMSLNNGGILGSSGFFVVHTKAVARMNEKR